MALLAPTAAVLPPVALTMATPAGSSAGSDTVQAAAGLALLVHNPTAGALNLTIGTPTSKDVYGAAVPDIVASIPATSYRVVALPSDLADGTGLIGIGAAAGIVYRPITF